MRNCNLFAVALVALFAAPLMAATGGRTLVVGILAPSSITVTIPSADGGGTYFSNPGTDALWDVGQRNKYIDPPSGMTLTRTSTSWTLAFNFVVLVTKSNLTSANYTLKATAVPNVSFPWATWKIDGVDITSPILGTITTTGTYAVNRTCTMNIVIQSVARSSTSISEAITLSAIGN